LNSRSVLADSTKDFTKQLIGIPKSFNSLPIYPSKISWDYCKKTDSDDIINYWKIKFQASDGKGKHFLDLLDDNFNVIEPFYTKEGP